MIYYLDNPVVWDKNLKKTETRSQIEQLVYDEIAEIRNRYFGDKGIGRVKLLYPAGKPKEKDGGWTILKQFPIPLWSTDGSWRWTSARKPQGKDYVDHHIFVKHATVFTEKDIEFLWFLKNRSSMLNKFVFIEDLEEEAKTKNEAMSSDADIRFMLLGSRSPIAKDDKLIRQVAEIFGLKEVEKKGIEQIKQDLYNALVEGEKMKDRFCNYQKFEELTQGDLRRKAAYQAKCAINDGIVKYKDRAWWIVNGNLFEEKLVTIKAGEGDYREQLFIDEVVNNASVRSRLFAALGVEEITTAKDFSELDRVTLQRKCKEVGIKVDTKDTNEDMVEKLCKHYNIDYQPKG